MSAASSLVSQDCFTFAFEGENEINAGLLGMTLNNLAYVLDQVAKDDPAKANCSLSVRAIHPGSVVMDFVVTATLAAQMAGICTIQDACSIVSILKGMFDIKAHLKGDAPKAVDEHLMEGYIRVIAKDGSDVTAPLGSKVMIADPAVSQKISEIALASKEHDAEHGFYLSHGEDVFHYGKEEVSDISMDSHTLTYSESNHSRTQRISLLIKTVNLLGKGAWSFKYGRHTISAPIDDPVFMKSVHDGVTSYTAGNKLDVELETTEKLAPDNTLIGETYRIITVYGIIK